MGAAVMTTLMLVVLVSIFLSAEAFLSEFGGRRPASTSFRMKSNNNSYRRMLKKAKDGRPKKQNASVQPDAIPPAPSAVPQQEVAGGHQQQAWEQADTESMSTRERAKFKNQVPFSADMYETIKTCITMLSDRSNKENPKKLSADEAQWFKEAVEVILEDAHMYGPPKRPERMAAPPPEEQE